jgi:hypothetical protein
MKHRLKYIFYQFPKDFFTYSNTSTATSTEKSLLNYPSGENDTNPKVAVFNGSGENVVCIDRNCNVNIDQYYNNDMIKKGAVLLSLFSQDKIDLVNNLTTTQLKITVNNLIFPGEKENSLLIIPRFSRFCYCQRSYI